MSGDLIKAGGLYGCRPRAGHGDWVVRVNRISVTSIEVSVVRGQNRGKSKFFRMNRALFERDFTPVGRK